MKAKLVRQVLVKKRKEVLFRCQQPGRWGTLVSKLILTSQCRQGFHNEGEEKQNKEIGGDARGVQAVSLLVLIWNFNVSIMGLVSTSQIPAVVQSLSAEVVLKAFLVQAGTLTAGAGNMLIREQSVCAFLYHFVGTSYSNSISC